MSDERGACVRASMCVCVACACVSVSCVYFSKSKTNATIDRKNHVFRFIVSNSNSYTAQPQSRVCENTDIQARWHHSRHSHIIVGLPPPQGPIVGCIHCIYPLYPLYPGGTLVWAVTRVYSPYMSPTPALSYKT